MEVHDIGFWKNRKVFVTGGSGFIGSHLVSKLSALEADVKLLEHLTSVDKRLVGISGDLSGNIDLTNFLNSFKPDVVFHLAAQPIVGRAFKNPLEALETNVRGTYKLLNSCKNVESIRAYVHISTDKVYGNIEVIDDSSIPKVSGHPYNDSKLQADISTQMYADFYKVPAVIIRNGNVYGPGDYHWDRVVPRTIMRVYYNESPVLRGECSRDFVYVDDLVIGYLNAAKFRYYSDKLCAFNLGSKQVYSIHSIITKIIELVGNNVPIVREPLWDGELVNQHLESQISESVLGWSPNIDLDSGLEKTVKWYINYLENT